MIMDKINKKNKLSESTSPYLQQHADNPVDWYPWCDEALQLAKQQNKPILLSIGYSACHWCHVMAHESFEDEETAELMNRYFINIKVDREERPDLDKVYQLSHQIITGRSGGWPLTVFLTPDDHMPFFIGTYFPKEPRYNLMTFKEILQRVHEFYLNHFDEIKKQNIQLNLAFKQLHRMPNPENEVLTNAALFNARHELEKEFDAQNGGFGDAPKFPQSLNLQRLLQHFDAHPKDTDAKDIVLSSLYKMAQAGIIDHIGGGFFRYAVDNAWQIPHFEKMLYDNALLLNLYIDAYRKFQLNDFAEIAREICGWALREMCDNNGFYSTLDADSEKLEGKYYYWDREEIRTLLEDDEYQVITYLFGFDHPANFEHHWHLTKRYTITDLAKKLNLTEDKILAHLKSAKQKLFNARVKRVYPHRDEKILTSWNALIITALVKTGFYLKEKTFSDAGLQTLSFIKNNLWIDTNLFACYKDGKVSQKAFLDDYAFLLEACLTSLQYHWDKDIFIFAQTLAEKLMTLFYDEKNHGFFFTSNEHENLIDRPKSFMDEALPAGAAIATLSLTRLGHLIGEIRYLNAGENSVKLILPLIEKYPFSHCGMLNALEECLNPPSIIILRGNEPELTKWRDKCLEGYHPHRFVLAIPKDEKDLPLCLAKYFASENDMTAYVCKGTQCLPPVYSWAELEKIL